MFLGKASIGAPPLQYPYPALGVPDPNANFDSSDTYQQGLNVGDSVFFNEYWGLRAGLSQDWFHVDNFKKTGVRTTEYANEGLSPTGSILFKPAGNMTTYFTYASSLQAGDLAPTGTVNQGESLAPYRSTEYELGYKATLGKVDLTAAVFRIERPFANIFAPTNTFEISGDQINKGVEFSAVGEIATGLTLYGGVQLLNARLENTPLLSTNDKIYVGAPKVKGNMLFEYHRIPGVAGLVATLRLPVLEGTRRKAANAHPTLVLRGRIQPVRFGRPLRLESLGQEPHLAPGRGQYCGQALLVHRSHPAT